MNPVTLRPVAQPGVVLVEVDPNKPVKWDDVVERRPDDECTELIHMPVTAVWYGDGLPILYSLS